MNRIARSAVAVLLTTGLALAGIGSGSGFGFGGATVNGGATGCCRDIA